MSSEHSELRVLRGIHHHHASLHELVSLHSHMLIAQIEKLRTDVATLETDLTESRLQQQKQLSVLRDQQEVLESQNAEIESARSAKTTHATEMESVRNSLQREIQTLLEKVTVTEVALEAEAAAKRAAEAALISMRADNEKKILDVKAQLGEHHKELLTQQRILLSETFAKEAELKQAAAIALEREKFAEKMAETKSLLRSVVETLKKENEELSIQLEDLEKENDELLSRLERAESVVRSAQQVSLAASLAAEARERAEREGKERIERLEMEAREKVEKETREKAQRDEQERIEKERIAKEEEEIEQQNRVAAEEEAARVAVITAERIKNEKNEQDALIKETSTKSSSSISSASASSPSPVRAFGAKLGGSTSTSTSPFGATLNGAKKSTPSFLSSVAAARLHEQTTKTAESIPSSSSIASTEVPPLTSSSSSSSSSTAATEVIPIEERARREAERLRNRSVFGGGIKKDAANDPPAAAPPSVPKSKIGATPTPVAAPVTAPIAPVAILSNNSQPIQVLSVPSSTPTSAPAPIASKALDMLAGVSVVDSAPQSTETASVSVSSETIEIEDSYTSMNKEELKALLSDRGLFNTGKMKELRSRLRDDDLAKELKEKEERKAKKKQEKAAAAAVKVVTSAEEGSFVPTVPIRKPPPAPPG